MKGKKVVLFGSSSMAEEYLKVLKDLACDVSVIGRNNEKAGLLARKYGAEGFGGGIAALSEIDIKKTDLVIVASAVESLKKVSAACLSGGANNILIEKPGGINFNELEAINQKIEVKKNVGIAYNRRFYNSVLCLKDKIKQDGGPIGCFFDFTEREKDVFGSTKGKAVVNKWGFANSSHVIDTAFYLIGIPEQINCLIKGSWECHPSGNIFVGSGMTKHCLFSYFSTWAGGGRWNIEVSTKEGRYKLSPLEELSFCKKNQFKWEAIPHPDDDDKKYKPGLYKMVKSILEKNDFSLLPRVSEQIKLCKVVDGIFGYEN